MAQLSEAEKDRIIDKCLPAVRRSMKKALGSSGFGEVKVEFKGWKPRVESLNRDREPVEEEPQE